MHATCDEMHADCDCVLEVKCTDHEQWRSLMDETPRMVRRPILITSNQRHNEMHVDCAFD